MRTNLAKAVRKGLVKEVLKHGKITTSLTYARSIRKDLGDKPFRIIRLGQRLSDASERVVLELIKKEEKHEDNKAS